MKPKNEFPEPKPRKHITLWQFYLWWYELVEVRKRHLLRISAIEKGRSQMDAQVERDTMEHLAIDKQIDDLKKSMVNIGTTVSVWPWLTEIKGLGSGSLAAQLVAQIDDIGNFDNVAKLWRFAGFAVIDGKAEKNQKGEKSHFNRKLKGVCFNIAESFIKQQTPYYVDIYYDEKQRQREKYPEPIKNGSNGKLIYTDAHIHNRAWRKMVKEFLKDLWIAWRQYEGLPIE